MSSAPSPTPLAPDPTPAANTGPAFLDPKGLIEASEGQRFVPPAWPVLFIVMALVVASASLSGPDAGAAQAAVVVGLIIAWTVHAAIRRSFGRGIAAEIQAVNAIEELVQLRRWMEAADLTQRVLSRPMYIRERRLAAMVCLASLLTRYHRFTDARVVHEFLLSDSAFDSNSPTAHSIRVARAIGMLREDYLVDADKAMGDLRREVNRARDEVRRHRGVEAANEVQSAGLALLELYRDVKTRHYEEAVVGFERSRPVLRDQLGMRVAGRVAARLRRPRRPRPRRCRAVGLRECDRALTRDGTPSPLPRNQQPRREICCDRDAGESGATMSAPVETIAAVKVSPKLLSISADRAIALVRWWLRLGAAFNVLMIAAVFVTSVIGFRQGFGSLPAFVASIVWFGLLVISVRARRLAIDAAPLIAAGEFGLAEDRLSQSLRTFSVLRSTRLLGLQQLAMLRHSQSNWADVAKLCRELIDRQRPGERSMDVPSRLMLVESLVELGDVRQAQHEIAALGDVRLGLRETLLVTALRLESQVRAGLWADATRNIEATLAMVELMPSPALARAHALLALAAKRQGLSAWHETLARRGLLLADVDSLTAGREFLREALEGITQH